MWEYQESIIESLEQMPVGTIGFIYRIDNPDTGQHYIGKKSTIAHRTLPALKGQKRKRKVVKESDWRRYQSSNKTVKEWISPKKTILRYCYNNKQMTYWENKYLYCNDVLTDNKSLNDNISGKFFKTDVL
jgi:hypothetical protein